MSTIYNSKIISLLYKQGSDTEKILDEMGEIADPVFIYPIYENWKSFNSGKSFISHYFISALQQINSDEVLKIAIMMFKESMTTKDCLWLFPIFEKYKYFDTSVLDYALSILKQLTDHELKSYITEYNLQDIVRFFRGAKKTSEIQEYLRSIFCDEDIEYDIRKMALYHLFRNNPNFEIQYILDNYTKLSSDDVDTMLAREFANYSWKGPRSEALKLLLIKNGKGRSKDILAELEKEKVVEEKKKIEKETEKYANTSIVIEVNSLRTRINSAFISKENFGFSVFEDSEGLISQQERAVSREQLVSKCSELRAVFTKISSKTSNHSLSEKEMIELLPTVDKTEYGKPLNRLLFFLKSKGVAIDVSIFGLREVNRLTNLLVHADQEQDLIKVLTSCNLIEQYKKNDWGSIHAGLLMKYKTSLEKLLEALTVSTEAELKS